MSLTATAPPDMSATIAEQARRMRSAGHGLHDIASALRVHPEQVRRWLMTIEHDEAAQKVQYLFDSDRPRQPIQVRNHVRTTT
jgi:predicted ArsR family transcriptional regulator